jgi:hypothetical protein
MKTDDSVSTPPELIVDLVNDLKAENAELRRELFSRSAFRLPIAKASSQTLEDPLESDQSDFPPANKQDQSVSICRACCFLEGQVERISGEMANLRAHHADVVSSYEMKLRQQIDGLARESHRRARMESIIQRQQSHIKELTLKLSEFLSVDSRSAPQNRGDQTGENRASSCRNSSTIWELDMDDLNRQLTELDDNVQRVQHSSDRLSSTALEAHGNIAVSPLVLDGTGNRPLENSPYRSVTRLEELMSGFRLD